EGSPMSDWPSHDAGRACPLDEIDLAHLWYELDLDHAQLPPIAPQPTPALKRRGADTTAKSGRTRASLRSHALHRLYRLLVARRTAERNPLAEWIEGPVPRPPLRETAGRMARRSA